MRMLAVAAFIVVSAAGCAKEAKPVTITGEAYLTNLSGGAERQAGMLVYLLEGNSLSGLDSLVSIAHAQKDAMENIAIKTVLEGRDSIRARQRQIEARYEKETQDLTLKFIKQYGGSTARWPSDASQQMRDRKEGAPMDATELEMTRLQKDITEQVKEKTKQLKSEFEHHLTYLIMSAVIDSARTDIEGRFEIAMPKNPGEYHLFAERGNRAWYVPVKIEKMESQTLTLAPYNIGTHPFRRLEF